LIKLNELVLAVMINSRFFFKSTP